MVFLKLTGYWIEFKNCRFPYWEYQQEPIIFQTAEQLVEEYV